MHKIEIISDSVVLHYDEYPILFVGKNANAQNVLGSFVYEENDTLYFFHSIVSNQVLEYFLHQKISYLSILLTSKSVYLVEKDLNEHILKVKSTIIEKINPEFLPLPSSFCPNLDEGVLNSILPKDKPAYILTEPSIAMAYEDKLEYRKASK